MQEISIDKFLEEKHLDIIFNSYLIYEAVKGRNRIVDSLPSESEIIRAIKNRKYVGIYYEDEEDTVLNGFRLIEPLVLGSGYKKNSGEVVHTDRKYLRAFVIKDTSEEAQFNNSTIRRKSVSKSKRVPYYRLFRLDRISSWFEFPKKFSNSRELYNPDDKKMGSIIANLQFDDFPKGEKQIHLTKALRAKMNRLNKK